MDEDLNKSNPFCVYLCDLCTKIPKIWRIIE
jgi:hypothetical protein